MTEGCTWGDPDARGAAILPCGATSRGARGRVENAGKLLWGLMADPSAVRKQVFGHEAWGTCFVRQEARGPRSDRQETRGVPSVSVGVRIPV